MVEDSQALGYLKVSRRPESQSNVSLQPLCPKVTHRARSLHKNDQKQCKHLHQTPEPASRFRYVLEDTLYTSADEYEALPDGVDLNSMNDASRRGFLGC